MHPSVIRLFVVIVLLTSIVFATERGALMLQGQLSIAKPLSPTYVTDYWSSATHFSGGFGFALKHGVALLTYTNQTFNRKDGIVADGANAFAHEVLINFKKFLQNEGAAFEPFVQLAGGCTLLRTPVLFKESSLFPGQIDEQKFLEGSHAQDGFTLAVGVGLNYELSEISMIFFELGSSTTFLKQEMYPNVQARTGVLFQLGN